MKTKLTDSQKQDFSEFCPMDTGEFCAENEQDAFARVRAWAAKHGLAGPLRVEIFTGEGHKIIGGECCGELSALVTRSKNDQNVW